MEFDGIVKKIFILIMRMQNFLAFI